MNTWQFSQLKWALGLGSLMTFYGVVNVAVWVLGTQLGYPVEYRIVVIAFILLTMPFTLLIGYVASRRSKKKEEKAAEAEKDKEADAKTGDAEGAQKLDKPTGNYDDIEKSSEEVVQFLKSSNLGEAGKEAIYSLPWYLVLGAPKSGKTSLVISSKLNFQTLPSQRESEQKFVRPTRAVDWRVTSDAVFVDTAGRYQTEGVDQDEWAGLLETIKKKRPKRPLDGCLLIVNTDQILSSREAEIEQIAKILRARLDEAIERTKIRFPVYLIFTNADSIEGFSDSFSTSKQEGKNLVWGSTIPLEKSDNAQSLFDGEYGILQDSVMKRRLMRLSAPFAPVRQLRIFNFPLHFGSARRKIGAFVTTLFRPNPFSESPFLRGFYFTAAPPARSNRSNAPQTVGNSHFTERFFRDVLLRDKDLVATFQQQKQRAPIFGWILTIFVSIITLFLLIMSAVSMNANRVMLNAARDRGEAVLQIVANDKGTNPLDKDPQSAQTELTATKDLYNLMAEMDDHDRNGPPIYMRFGLYSGKRVYREHLLPIFFNVIEQRFKKPTVARVEEELKKFSESNPVANPKNITDEETDNLDKHYNLLQAYMMLSKDYKQYADPTQITGPLKDYWISSSKLPKGTEGTAEKLLEFWATQVDRETFRGVDLNKELVEKTQAKLKVFPAANRFYKRKMREISEKLNKQLGKMRVEDILSRKSADSTYLEGNFQVSTAYTREGYEMLKKELSGEEANKELNEPDWVLGETTKDATAQTADAEEVKKLYFRDYVTQWTNFVRNTRVKPFPKDNPEYAKKALEVFSSPDSPIKVLAEEIARNTNFSTKAPPSGWIEYFKSFLPGSGEKTEGGGETSQVEEQFLPLFGFVGDTEETKEKAPINSYIANLSDVYTAFKGFSPTKIKQISQELAKDNDQEFTELGDASDEIDGLVKNMESSDSTAGKALANFFKQPLNELKQMLGADVKSQVEKQWKETLAASKEIEKDYPFNNGGSDIDLKKMSDFFKSKGTLNNFFDDYLSPYLEKSDSGEVKPKDGAEIEFNEGFINYLNNAFRLQKALFAGGDEPKIQYTFALKPVENAIIEVTIDGQQVKSDGTGSNKMNFPAGSGQTGAIMKFASTAPANSPETPVTNQTPNVVQNSGCASSAESITCPGDWGLFRFFDKGNPPQNQENGEHQLTYSFGGKTVKATVNSSGLDVFNRSLFTSVRAPESIFK
ncbi:MAG: type VI secretion system membrane subunit TssM [Pyrinomonadaceae bacterium]